MNEVPALFRIVNSGLSSEHEFDSLNREQKFKNNNNYYSK